MAAVHLGTPCASFSRARDRPGGPPPLRSNAMVGGLPGLRECDQVKVTVGNLLAAFTISILTVCKRMVIPGTAENPQTSRLWIFPCVANFLQVKGVVSVTADYCQFGMPWRKSTRIIGVNVALDRLERRCTLTGGVCSKSD